MDETMLSIGETARLMNVCENTLRNWDIAGSFSATRTQGEHRRYSLSQIRTFLEKNQKIEEMKETVESKKPFYKDPRKEVLERWESSEHLSGISDLQEKENLAILLDNINLYYETAVYSYPFLTKDQAIWLTREGWLRSKLRRTVSISSMMGPCEIVYHRKSDGKFDDDAVAAKTYEYRFAFFVRAKWDDVKDLYADAIAAELDIEIFNHLPSINLESTLKASRNYVSMKEIYDYIAVSPGTFDEVKNAPAFKEVDVYSMPATFLDPESFCPKTVAGKYPTNGCVLPVFCPYFIFTPGTMSSFNVSTPLKRHCWLESKERNHVKKKENEI